MPTRLCRLTCDLAAAVAILAAAAPLGAEVTTAQVNEAIARGVAFLERQQRPDGRWTEYDSEPGGATALCTLALLHCGRTPDDTSVRKALAWLERQPDPEKTYSTSLRIMVFVQADPKKYALPIKRLALWLAAHQMRDEQNKGGWTYRGPAGGSADNSNSQFAVLALHEAERAGVEIPDQTWNLVLQYWTQPGMQAPSGGYGYGPGQEPTGSMTCAAIASLILARDRLHAGDARVVEGQVQCCGGLPADDPTERAIAWLGNSFSVARNPGHRVGGWWLYYLYALERVGRMSGQRFFVTTRQAGRGALDIPELHDWYREGCEILLQRQDKFTHSWTGIGTGEGNPEIGTAFALLFLAKGRRPVVLAKLRHSAGGAGGVPDWDRHRRAVQNLTLRVERLWQRELSWQTIDFTRRPLRVGGAFREAVQVTAADLLEAPVLLLSGSEALDLDDQQRQVLREYLQSGGFLLAEACDGAGCDGRAFDRSFRQLMRELFPDSELRRLPPDHPVWYAQEKVDPKHLPDDPEFWLWGLEACCRTSVVYCPRSLTCYWELGHPYRPMNYPEPVRQQIEQVLRIGGNILAYATNRELKEKLDRPQVLLTQTGRTAARGALVVGKLNHGGGADDAPAALNHLLLVMEQQLQMRVDYQKRLVAPSDPKLFDVPILFFQGRRSFRFSASERKALRDYLERGGFLFGDAICASQPFADALKSELAQIFPEGQWQRLPPTHPVFTDEFHGFRITTVRLRDPQRATADDPLTARWVTTTPLLEGFFVEGRPVVIFSPYDLSCALERGASLDCKGYAPEDAARLAANMLLYGLRE